MDSRPERSSRTQFTLDLGPRLLRQRELHELLAKLADFLRLVVVAELF
jgi:hypothetical protein